MPTWQPDDKPIKQALCSKQLAADSYRYWSLTNRGSGTRYGGQALLRAAGSARVTPWPTRRQPIT